MCVRFVGEGKACASGMYARGRDVRPVCTDREDGDHDARLRDEPEETHWRGLLGRADLVCDGAEHLLAGAPTQEEQRYIHTHIHTRVYVKLLATSPQGCARGTRVVAVDCRPPGPLRGGMRPAGRGRACAHPGRDVSG
jgi:hypothetical protein